MLRKILAAKIALEPVGAGRQRGYNFRGTLSLERLIEGEAMSNTSDGGGPNGIRYLLQGYRSVGSSTGGRPETSLPFAGSKPRRVTTDLGPWKSTVLCAPASLFQPLVRPVDGASVEQGRGLLHARDPP